MQQIRATNSQYNAVVGQSSSNWWLSCHRFFYLLIFVMQAGEAITNEQQIKRPFDQVDFNVNNSLSFSDFKNSLGSAANNHSDEEIEKARISCDKIADLLFDAYLAKKGKRGLM
jgi:hypothetical protein